MKGGAPVNARRARQNIRMRTFGVEEELLIVDPEPGEPLDMANALIDARPVEADDEPVEMERRHAGKKEDYDDEMGLSAELKLEKIETQSRPCTVYGSLLEQIRAGRALAD